MEINTGTEEKKEIKQEPGVSTSNSIQKSNKENRKRRRAIRDVNSPKQPLSGYIIFLNKRREEYRAENPTIPFGQIAKVLGNEWTNMSPEEKDHYVKLAEQEKERYQKEIAEYKETEAFKAFQELQSVITKMESNESSETANDGNSHLSIPIFTEEFLDFNKNLEGELRKLRKTNLDLEKQNSSITNYLENMNGIIDKLTIETEQQKKNNIELSKHLQHLRTVFTAAFSGVNAIPGFDNPNIDNIDDYICNILKIIQENPNHPIINNVRHAISQLDLKNDS